MARAGLQHFMANTEDSNSIMVVDYSASWNNSTYEYKVAGNFEIFLET